MAEYSDTTVCGYWPRKERHYPLPRMELSHYRWNFR